MHVHIFKIYALCVSLYIHKYIQYTFILDAINRFVAGNVSENCVGFDQ